MVAGIGLVMAGLVAAPATAFLDRLGTTIANTSTLSPVAQLVAGPQTVQMLALPQDPSINTAAVLDKLGSPKTPEEDLANALAQIAATTDPAAAARARQLALDILEGNPIAGKPYSGMPLLNWNVPSRVQTVPAGGNVTIREVRFGQHVLTDTWLLQFADTTKPFTITYRVSELGGSSVGSELTPTPLVNDGGAIGGLHSVVQPLGVSNQLTGATIVSTRFAPNGAPENTREVTQDVTVRMPAPKFVTAVLDPNLRPGHEAMATLLPATPERLAAAQAAFGFSGPTPTGAQKAAAIGLLADTSPEKQLWRDLSTLDPANATARQAVATSGATRVAQMRVRQHLPSGVTPVTGADVTVALVNDEAYVSSAVAHVTTGSPLKIGVTNADGFAHTITGTDLHNRNAVFGAKNWGEFRQSPLALGAAANLAPGSSALFSLNVGVETFELVLGDPDRGDQSSAAIAVEHGAVRQSLQIGAASAAPQGGAADSAGNVWLALHGVDQLAKITAPGDLGTATTSTFKIPGGNFDNTSVAAVQGPKAVAIDDQGMVFATLAEGNAIARLDPAKAKAGASDGITVLPLHACGTQGCNDQFPPPAATAPPSRFPDRLALATDSAGNTVVWFTEHLGNAIGMMKVDKAGNVIDSQDVTCDCDRPSGIGVDGTAVWFSEFGSSRMGRITASAGGAPVVDHFNIPSNGTVADPINGENNSAGPDGVAVDKAGRVWFAERAAGKVAFLDPRLASPGTTKGITEFALPGNDFNEATGPGGITVDAAGTVFYANAMGDRVGSVTPAGAGPVWAVRDRRNQMGTPLVDPKGNVWVSEIIGSALTRLSGVAFRTAPPDPPAPAPTVNPTTSPSPAPAPKPTTTPANPVPTAAPVPSGPNVAPAPAPRVAAPAPAPAKATTPAPAPAKSVPAKVAAASPAKASTTGSAPKTASGQTAAASANGAVTAAGSSSGATKVLGSTIEKSGPTASRPLVTQPADFQQAKKSSSVRYILAAVGALLLLLNAVGAFKVPMLSRPRRDD